MKIDWLNKLQYFLQTMAFCLAVSAIQFAFQPQWAYEIALVYSVCIGTCIWAMTDFGRHLVPSAAETGWPQGAAGFALPLVATVVGYVLGTLAGDQVFGWSSWSFQVGSKLPASIIITALAGTAASYYFYTRTRHGYLQRRVEEARGQAMESRLKLLETQLEPHMLFNTLANLRALIGTDPTRAQTMLDHMVAYLRATLSASRSSTHPLEREFERLQDYLELMTIRMGPRLQFTLDLPDDLRQHPLPSLLLQPLVENSIQHGLEPKVAGGSITVRARRSGNRLTLEVEDTGLGFDATRAGAGGATQDGRGFGLSQVRERLATTYGTEATINLIADSAGGTRASITFPYKP